MPYFLINPTGKARAQVRRRTRKQRRVTMARRKKRRRNNAPRARRRSYRRRRNNPGFTVMNPRRRRRRRNPFGVRGGRGFVGTLTNGAMDALGIVTGKAVSRALPALVGLSQTGFAGVAIQAVASIAAGFVGNMVSPRVGRLMVAGGLAGIVEGYIKAANIPIISPALGDEYDAMGAWAGSEELAAAAGRLGLYPGSEGFGEEEGEQEAVGMLPG